MSLVENFLCLSLFLLSIILLFQNTRGKAKNTRLPPGNSSLLYISHTLSLFKPHPYGELRPFVEDRVKRYGKIFQVNLFGSHGVVSTDADFNNFVLQNEGTLFQVNYTKNVVKLLGKTSVFWEVNRHKQYRSTMTNFLNYSKLRTHFLPIIDGMACNILDSWNDRSDVIHVQEETRKMVFNIMVKKILNVDPEKPNIVKMRGEYGTFTAGVAALPLNFPGTTYWKALQSRAVILKILEDEIEEKEKIVDGIKDEVEDELTQDFVAILVKYMNPSKEQIVETLLGTFLAAHDTSSTAAALAVYFLQTCPKAIQQLREEHKNIVKAKKERGDEDGLNWEDYTQMNFARCVTNEVLRLSCIADYLYRKAMKDVEYKGFIIPTGWWVIPVIAAPQLDPSKYEDPRTFNPWRWENKTGLESITSGLTTFGGGPRLCPGALLSKIMVVVFIHHLVLKYDWELAEADEPYHFPYITFPKKLPIKVQPVNICKNAC